MRLFLKRMHLLVVLHTGKYGQPVDILTSTLSLLLGALAMQKPLECSGCPLFSDGEGFCPDDEPVEGATVFVLGQNPGEDEERESRAFIGKTGHMLINEFFPRGQLIRGENAICGNAIKCRWVKNGKKVNELPPAAILNPALTHCVKAHLRIPSDIKLVVACGALAWKAVGGGGNISDWRGFLLK